MRKLLLLLFTICSITFSQAQDPEFTQFYANPLYLNPAYAGTAKGVRLIFNYRNQWPSLPASFVTYSASYDEHFEGISGGLGAQLIYDRAGDGNLTTTGGNFMYSYFLPVSRKFAIKAGLEVSMVQKSIDFTKLLFFDQIDPKLGFIYKTHELPPVSSQFQYIDFSAGFLGFSEKFYIGFVADHLSEPQMSFYSITDARLPRKYTAHVGLMLPLDVAREHKTYFSPNILFQRQGNFSQICFGAYYLKNNFVFGAWFRQTQINSDAVMGLIGVQKDGVKIGYSYDVTVSDERYGGKGSHEVSVIIEIPTHPNVPPVKWRKLICPTF